MADELNVKQMAESMNAAFNELKEWKKTRDDKIEKGLGGVALLEEQIQKANAQITKMDEAFQKWTLKQESKAAGSTEADRTIEETKKAFWQFARYGACEPDLRKHLQKDSAPSQKAFAIGVDAAAGYLAPLDYLREILKGAIEYTPIRQLARVITTSATGIQVPKRTAAAAAAWIAETGTRTDASGQTYGLETILAHELYAYYIASLAMLEDSAFNLESELQSEGTIQFGVAEGTAFMNGALPGMPRGVLSYSTIGNQTCADSTNHYIAGADLLNAIHKLKEPYINQSTWLIKSSAVARLRTQVTSGGNVYVWGPLAENTPPTIGGRPYMFSVDLQDDGTASKVPAVLGAWRLGYVIVDRLSMDVLRDPYSKAATGQVQFIMRRRVGGDVVLPECFVKCTTA